MIPAEAIEAAAKGFYEACNPGAEWGHLDKTARAVLLPRIHRALEAAAPHMQAGAWKAGFWKGTEWVSSAGEDGSEDARFNNPHDGSTP